MNIYILRHGIAEDRDWGKSDALRQLTKQGKRELRAVLQRARAAGVGPDTILTSPLTRALETARIAAEELNCQRLVEAKELMPEVAPPQLWKEIRAQNRVKNLMLVGHEPQLSRLAGFLLEAPLSVDLKKGALLKIAVQDVNGPPRGVLKWLLTPKLARSA
ncbi:MAG TPA: phosphohistidine phosphatase SixA [Bryobacteraceae bacterium]|nr:phosphohistidine phosphatase SixA [Bryobacteraceae bacterium]